MEEGFLPPPPPPPLPPQAMNKQSKAFPGNLHSAAYVPALVHFAVNNENLEELQRLIKQGVNLDLVMLGNTALMLAIMKEQYDFAECLIAGGADVSKPEKFAWLRQPIHLASEAGQVDIVKLLIEHGASVHSADATLRTPLHCAAYNRHKDLIALLLDEGAHINCKDNSGRTPLFRAVETNDTDVVDFLIDNGATLNCPDKHQWLPIHHSIVCGQMPMIKHLLTNYWINIDFPTQYGDTALHLALSRVQSDRLDVLTRSGVNMYMQRVQAPTRAVHTAIRAPRCTDEIVELLIDYGCEMNRFGSRNGVKYTAYKLVTQNVVSKKTQLLIISAGLDISLEEQLIKDGIWPMSLEPDVEYQEFLTKLSKKKVAMLKEFCRFRIRRSLKPFIDRKIRKLPLPPLLQDYLYVTVENQPRTDI